MPSSKSCRGLGLLLAVACSLPASAASSTASSASDSSATSVGSASDSLKSSGNGSSKAVTAVADGDYRIVELAPAAERPGQLRLTLQALAAPAAQGGGAAESAQFLLYLPQPTAERSRLAPGQALAVRQRPYGLSFARADDGLPFFLVLADDALRELPSRPLAL